MTTKPQNLAEIQALLASITPGQWRINEQPIVSKLTEVVAPWPHDATKLGSVSVALCRSVIGTRQADGTFIAQAPEIVVALVDEIKTLRAIVESLHQAVWDMEYEMSYIPVAFDEAQHYLAEIKQYGSRKDKNGI